MLWTSNPCCTRIKMWKDVWTHSASDRHFPLFCFTDVAFFYRLKFCVNPASNKCISTIFPTAFSHFVSLCHILVILALFKLFCYYYICYGRSVILGVAIVIVLEHHEPCPYKTAKLVNVCVLTAPPIGCSPLSLSSGLPIPETQQY